MILAQQVAPCLKLNGEAEPPEQGIKASFDDRRRDENRSIAEDCPIGVPYIWNGSCCDIERLEFGVPMSDATHDASNRWRDPKGTRELFGADDASGPIGSRMSGSRSMDGPDGLEVASTSFGFAVESCSSDADIHLEEVDPSA